MLVWCNSCMGRNGWLIWLAILSFVFPLIVLSVLMEFIFQSGWSSLEQAFFVFGIIFVLYHIGLATLAIWFAFHTAKKVEITPKDVRLITFSGKSVSFTRSQSWALNTRRFTKPYHRIMFQKNCEHLVIQDDNHTCYISAYTEGFADLSEKLASVHRRN